MTTPKGGAYARRKGHDWERKVASDLREIYGSLVKRGWQSMPGHEAADVEGTPWHIECKKGIKPNLWAALIQAIRGSDMRKKAPVVIAAQDRGPKVALMLYEDWLELITDYERYRLQ